MEKMSHRPLYNFGKQLNKTAIARKKFFKKIYYERGLSKSLTKVNFMFLLNPALLKDKIMKPKRGLSDKSLFMLQNKF